MKKRDGFVLLGVLVLGVFLYAFLSQPEVRERVYGEKLGAHVGVDLERSALSPGGENWTIIHWPDTQNSLSAVQYGGNDGAAMLAQAEWIRDNAAGEDIKFVVHVGDIVSSPHNIDQWDAADRAADVLDAADVPYTVLPGNHDGHTQGNKPEDWTNYNLYFGPDRFIGKSWYGGSMEAGDNSNNYALFSAGGVDYVVVNIEVWPDSNEKAWANSILQQYSDRKAIFATHSLLHDLNGEVIYGTGYENMRYIFDDIIAKNDNVVAALAGHSSRGWRVDYADSGRGLPVMGANWGGRDGELRILKIDSIGDRIYVSTYSPYTDQHLTGESDKFYVPLFFDLGDNSPTSCVLSNAVWGVTSSQVGHGLTMSILGVGCEGHDIQFDVFDSGGQVVKDTQGQSHGEIRFIQMQNGQAQYSWTPTTAGEYTFVARVANKQSVSVSSPTLSVTSPSMCENSGELGIAGYWKLDESGNTAIDYAYRRDGEVNGEPDSVSGKLGNALSFVEGTVDDVRINHHDSLTGFDEMSISVWIKKEGVTGESETIVSKWTYGGAKGGYRIAYDGSGGEIGWSVWDNSVRYRNNANSVNLVDGNWHHIVGVYTGSELHTYLDGTKLPVVESDVGGPIVDMNKGQIVIGRLSHNFDFTRDEFLGEIDELVIYSKALSQSEIESLYNGGVGSNACELQLVQCGDGDDVCSQGETRSCFTAESYVGEESCNSICTGFGACVAQESCGDGIKNGEELCDRSSRECIDSVSGNSGVEECLVNCMGFGSCVLVPSGECDSGCFVEGECVSIGFRLAETGEDKYCNLGGSFSLQKSDGESCQNDFECFSNECSSKECIALDEEIRSRTGMLTKIWCWVTNVADPSEYDQCLIDSV